VVHRLFTYSYGVGKSKTSKRCWCLSQDFRVDCGKHHNESDNESHRYVHRVEAHGKPSRRAEVRVESRAVRVEQFAETSEKWKNIFYVSSSSKLVSTILGKLLRGNDFIRFFVRMDRAESLHSWRDVRKPRRPACFQKCFATTKWNDKNSKTFTKAWRRQLVISNGFTLR